MGFIDKENVEMEMSGVIENGQLIVSMESKSDLTMIRSIKSKETAKFHYDDNIEYLVGFFEYSTQMNL